MSRFRRRRVQVPLTVVAACFALLIGVEVVAGCHPGEAPDGDPTLAVASASNAPAAVTTGSDEATPTRAASVARGCVPVSPGSLGFGYDPFCVTWLDLFSDETEFVIRLTYDASLETFEHTVGPNITEFVFPPAEAPFGAPGAPPGFCVRRGAIEVALSVVKAGKAEEFDRTLVQGHCGDGEK